MGSHAPDKLDTETQDACRQERQYGDSTFPPCADCYENGKFACKLFLFLKGFQIGFSFKTFRFPSPHLEL